MRAFLIVAFLLICSFGCAKSIQTDAKSFELTMERWNRIGPCGSYNVEIEADGKVTARRNCLFFVECESYESNEISVEKRRCPKSESETIEKQLSKEEIKELIAEIEKIKFFSYKDDYSLNSENCSQSSTDSPNVDLTIKINQNKKTIKYDYGCWVNNWFGKENALQPLKDLENKINQTVGIENWTKGRK